MPRSTSAIIGFTLLAVTGLAECPQFWPMTVATTGGDSSWTSPTAVSPDADLYDVNLQFTDIRTDVVWNSIAFNNISVINLLDPNQLVQNATVEGPAPVIASAQQIVLPPPPDAPAFSGDLTVELDADGFARVSAANVTLGTADVVLPVFGLQTVTLVRVEVRANITVTPRLLADLDGDGLVGFDDLLIILGTFGQCGPDVPDTDGDECVTFDDLLVLLGAFGTTVCP